MHKLPLLIIGCLLAGVILAAGCGGEAQTRAPCEPVAKAPPPLATGATPAAPQGAAGPERAPAAPRPVRSPARAAESPADIAPARFEAAVYEVQMPAARAAELDAKALSAKAATAEDLRKALADFGDAKVLYRVDQPVNLYSESITIASREPIITGTRVTELGATINSVQYQQTGLIINISAGAPPKDSKRKGLDVEMRIELAALGDSGVDISPKTRAVIIRSVSIDHSEPLQYGRPFVMLNVSYPSKDEKAAVAYVVRGAFSEVQP
jgi:hypothetical protein